MPVSGRILQRILRRNFQRSLRRILRRNLHGRTGGTGGDTGRFRFRYPRLNLRPLVDFRFMAYFRFRKLTHLLGDEMYGAGSPTSLTSRTSNRIGQPPLLGVATFTTLGFFFFIIHSVFGIRIQYTPRVYYWKHNLTCSFHSQPAL